MFGEMEDYHPPQWAATLSHIPKKRIRLAMTNTPIHPWKLPGVPADFNVSVKRCDLSGSTLSGNKVGKLEFLMAEAVELGCRHVITCGPVQSNHCRSVSLCARQLGLTPHLFLRTDVTDVTQMGCDANMLLNRLCGSHVYLVPPQCFFNTHVLPKMKDLVHHIQSSSGEASYVIPVGGASNTGLFGDITLFEELRQQGVLEQFDDLVFPCGSGGTAAGLAIANHLTGGHLRLHGIMVSSRTSFVTNHVDASLRTMGLGHLRWQDVLRIVDGYDGKGYGVSTREELEFIRHVTTDTSVVLDPVYTVKAAMGLVKEMTNNPSAFQGSRVLFLHTGGIYQLFDGQMASLLQTEDQQSHIKLWTQI